MAVENDTVDTPPDEPYLQIGEVAERTGVTQRTLRFYEEKGLIKAPSRMDGGFRLYSEADIQRVEIIKHFQNHLGLSLAEIKEMVEAVEVKMQIAAEYRHDASLAEKRSQIVRAIEVTQRQLDLVSEKLGSLTEMKERLDDRMKTFRGWLELVDKAMEAEPTKQR